MIRQTYVAARRSNRFAEIRPYLAPFVMTIQLARRWIAHTRQRRALAVFDDRLLHDIGITRAQAAQECAKPFWR